MTRDTVSTQIPRKYQELIAAEQQALGCANRVECLDRILGSHFERKGEPESTMSGGSTSDPANNAQPAPAASSQATDALSLAKQLGDALASLTGAQQETQRWKSEVETMGHELEAWQSMEKHAPVPQMLDHLASCPNCQPQMQTFLDRYVNTLPLDKIKDLARAHKLWPPPAIDLPLSRRARS